MNSRRQIGGYVTDDGKIPITRAVFKPNYSPEDRVDDAIRVAKLVASIEGPEAEEAFNSLCRVVGISENILRNSIREIPHADD